MSYPISSMFTGKEILSLACGLPSLALFLLQEPAQLPLQSERTEHFLRTAEVTARESIPKGTTKPHRLTLTDGAQTAGAVWKTVNIFRSGITRFDEGGAEFNFRDSYKCEIAAYELDKLLDLGLVPAVVEREINGKRGSLQLWVEGTITEWERRQKNERIPVPQFWNDQLFKIRLLNQLTYNTDFNNASNILVDSDYRLFAVDHSRAFRLGKDLMASGDLTRFSRSVLEKLEALTKPLLQERLGRWLTEPQIDALMARRDKIMELAEKLIAEKGEAAVLYQ